MIDRKKRGRSLGRNMDTTLAAEQTDTTPLDTGQRDTGFRDAKLGMALGVTLYLITAVTICGNATLLVILLKNAALRTVTNSFIVSLAVSDLLTGLLVMPFCAAAVVNGSWPFLPEYCKATGFVHSACSIATMLNIMMVCSDRVLAVAKPLKYSIWFTPMVSGLMISYVWLHSIIFSAVPFYESTHTFRIYTYERAKGFCAFDWRGEHTFVIVYVIFSLLLPAVITLAFLLIILKHAKTQPSIMSLMPVPVAAVSVMVHSQPMVNYRRSTIQAMRTLFIITIAVAALWAPQIAVNFFDLSRRSAGVSESVRTSVMWLCLMSSMTNPIIFLSNRKFKQKFKEIFCPCLLKRSNVVGVVDASVTQQTASTALPYTSHFEPSHFASRSARPSAATIPEEHLPKVSTSASTSDSYKQRREVLLSVPRSVPVAKVEPIQVAPPVGRVESKMAAPMEAETTNDSTSSTVEEGHNVYSVTPQLHAPPAALEENETPDLV